MDESLIYTPSNDPITRSNTVFLEKSQNPEVLANNRKLCRQQGVKEGPQELRRLQHFVSQAIIKLLTECNITQQSGKPYVSSSPKGFLQGPDKWLSDKGYYLSGWPRGLPKRTITLKSLAHASQKQHRIGRTSGDGKSESPEPAQPKESALISRSANNDSDRDAEGSADEGPLRLDVPPYATSSSYQKQKVPTSSKQSDSMSPDSTSTLAASNPTSNLSSMLADSKSKYNFPNFDSSAVGLLVATDLSVVQKRKMDENPYPGVPSNATVNWVPPVSATREYKRARMAL